MEEAKAKAAAASASASASVAPAKQDQQQDQDGPVSQVLQVVDKKVRNLEKRKVRHYCRLNTYYYISE